MDPELESRSKKERRKAVVEGVLWFAAAEGAAGLPRERSGTRENRGARRRRRSARKRSCGDGECASGWQTS
eukprot:966743-Pleurochrysis_carterae.AAC.1